jgi:hypothetical protein
MLFENIPGLPLFLSVYNRSIYKNSSNSKRGFFCG